MGMNTKTFHHDDEDRSSSCNSSSSSSCANDGDSCHDESGMFSRPSKDTERTPFTSPSGSEELIKNQKKVRSLVKSDDVRVAMWREIVTGMLVIMATLVTITTYIILSREEVTDFHIAFNGSAEMLVAVIEFKMITLRDSLKTVSNGLTMYAEASSSPWPYVTMTDFDVLADQLYVRDSEHSEHGNHTDYYPPPPIWTAYIVNSSTRPKYEWFNYVTKDNNTSWPPYYVWGFNGDERDPTPLPHSEPGPFHPIHHFYSSKELKQPPIELDMMTIPGYEGFFREVQHNKRGGMSTTLPLPFVYSANTENDSSLSPHNAMTAGPMTLALEPVYNNFNDTVEKIQVASVMTIIQWHSLFVDTLHPEDNGLYCIVRNSCGENFTFFVVGPHAEFLGYGDSYHDERYEKYVVSMMLDDRFHEHESNDTTVHFDDFCFYTLDILPSVQYRLTHETDNPKTYTIVVAAVFFLTVLTFIAYDKFVQRRNRKIVAAAARSNAVVASLFPEMVTDRLLGYDDTNSDQKKGKKNTLKRLFDKNPDSDKATSRPMADFFPETTILFADLAGFTAWSSSREPYQVFILLETLFENFDLIAKRRRIFKVETIGDCYVAAAGLPEPRKDHAVAMARFASEILKKTAELTQKLEATLGPDTSELLLRLGLHSGGCTAGLLRGEKSRFQLFGDTMNTASRMESTGIPNKIHCSAETAELLISDGKGHWIQEREGMIAAKGKGLLKTYWVEPKTASFGSRSSRSNDRKSNDSASVEDQDSDYRQMSNHLLLNEAHEKVNRLIDWNVEILHKLIEQIAQRRETSDGIIDMQEVEFTSDGKTPFEEVVEIISLPQFDATASLRQSAYNYNTSKLPESVRHQLQNYVTKIAQLYNDNPFHNFEHASHVIMSVSKLMSRIVAPSDILNKLNEDDSKDIHSTLHEYTYGIFSDALTQFACIFSALIHDADHSGVPNAQLIKENPELAEHYNGRSVAEQRSIDLCWNLLMTNEYTDLRNAICGNQEELIRFRQLVVNSVMATDIMDKDLKQLRNARWDKAFKKEEEENIGSYHDPTIASNRKATIVIEHIIQASDVSHTMQHWNVYRKWNERFFAECYRAFLDGRANVDPSEFWYKGEIGFFDFYIIPLAQKLKECGVFGVSSDEYLNYALKNKTEWEQRGEEIVHEMVEKIRNSVQHDRLI